MIISADFSTIPVSFLVSGGDHTFFTAPDPFSITVNRSMLNFFEFEYKLICEQELFRFVGPHI